jgi:hypothetical protein
MKFVGRYLIKQSGFYSSQGQKCIKIFEFLKNSGMAPVPPSMFFFVFYHVATHDTAYGQSDRYVPVLSV